MDILNDYIEINLTDIFSHLRYAECLAAKRSMPRLGFANLDEYERNEQDIVDAELNLKIARANVLISDKKKRVTELFYSYFEELNFINSIDEESSNL